MRYTQQQKSDALRQLRLCDNDFTQASTQTGIPTKTMRKWQVKHQSERAERLLARLQLLEEDLIENTLRIMESLEQVIENAPLNQRTSAVGTLIDRYLKVNEHLREVDAEDEMKEIPLVYYTSDAPDTPQATPPWAEEDSDNAPSLQSGRVWSPVWEDRIGQGGTGGTGGEREDMLVARPHLLNGDAGLARFEDGDEDYADEVRVG